MNTKLERYRQLRDKKKARLEKAQKDMDRLEQMVQDEENTQIVAAVRSYSLTPEELEAFLMAFKLKNHLFPDESARCFVPEEEEEISEMLLKAQKFAEDIDKSNPVRRIASADLSADPDALES